MATSLPASAGPGDGRGGAVSAGRAERRLSRSDSTTQEVVTFRMRELGPKATVRSMQRRVLSSARIVLGLGVGTHEREHEPRVIEPRTPQGACMTRVLGH